MQFDGRSLQDALDKKADVIQTEFEKCDEDKQLSGDARYTIDPLWTHEQDCLKLRQDLQVLCNAASEMWKKADDLQVALDMQERIKKLQDECQALQEKREATEEELADRIRQSQVFSTQLKATQDRQRAALSEQRRHEADGKEACLKLHSEEGRLANLQVNIQAELQVLAAELSKIKAKNLQESEDWASSAVEVPSYKELREVQRAVIGSQEEALRTLCEVKRQRFDTIARLPCCHGRTEKWQRLCSSYAIRAEEQERDATELELDRDKAVEHADALHLKLVEVLNSRDEFASKRRAACTEAARHAMRRALRLRQVAAFSPVLASWLTCIWWLAVLPMIRSREL